MVKGERRLAAIMFTDIVGYTAMAQSDELRALGLLRKQRDIARPLFARHEGREVKTMGDAFLVEFPSALAATKCAIDLENALKAFNEGRRDKVRVKVGIHVGDVVHEGGDIYGDAVNIASRIQSLAEGGGVCVSQQAYDQVRNKVPFRFSKLEVPGLKNVSFPIDVYRLELLERRKATAEAPDARRRLAVLPFTNMSPDPADEYFSDGLTEEMISTLSKLPEIDVISRTSIMQYKKAPKPIKDVYRELNSATILEGSVRKDGARVRVTVQMIDAQKDRHLWAETYDRELSSIFEIQSEIARLVTDALRIKILPSVTARIARGPTANPDAYTLYLRGRYHWNIRGLSDIRKAADLFERAVRKDPSFALGYVGLGDCYHVLATRFEIDAKRNWGRSRAAVAKALRLDPGLAEAHATKGVALFADFELRKAEEEFSVALELKPSYASAHQWFAQLLIARLRWEEALSHIERAAELDPFSQAISMVHTFLYEAKRDYGTGLRLAERAVELNPRDPGSHIELAWLCGKLKMFNEMEKELKAGISLLKDAVPFAGEGKEAMVAYLRDDRERVRKVLPKLEAHLGKTFTVVRFIADLHFYLGEVDEGFRWLKRSYSKKEFDLFYVKSDEFLDGVRTDSRYLGLLDMLGLA
ncbi:MAG: tetratricopeptide repeat protein [Nitrososphaerota archaeon]|nr:tetratricopeptide repeat protein [Nitrososphaerota archaeon]